MKLWLCLSLVALLVLSPLVLHRNKVEWITPAEAQERTNTFYVSEFRGTDVATKVTNAQASCSVNTSIPCVIVIDAVMAVWPQGSLPGRCAQCIWLDYRAATFNATPLTVSPGSSFLAADGTANAPGYAFQNETNSGWYRTSAGTISFSVLGIHLIAANTTNFQTGSAKVFCWSSSTSADGAGCDAGLSRVNASTIAVGNGTTGNASGTIQAATAQASRVKVNLGTAYTAADGAIVLSAGWGNTAAVSAATGSFDEALHFSVTSNGTGIAANPTITITFKDGTFTAVPTYTCGRVDNAVPNQPTGLFWLEAATTLTITAVFTPTAGNVYSFRCTGVGN
jgi:hypothetical protein